MQETEKDDRSGSEYLSNVASCKRRSASSLYLHIVSTPPCKIADIPNTYTVCAFEEQNKHSIQNHMNALATCAASAWYLTLNMSVIFLATFIEPLAKREHGRLPLARTIHNSTASVIPCAAGFPLLRGRPPFGSIIISALLSS